MESLQYKCIDYFKYDTFDEGSDAESFCRGTGTLSGDGYTFQEYIDIWGIDDYYLENNLVVDSKEEINLTSYNDTCGADVVIPREIDGYSITNNITTTVIIFFICVLLLILR